MEVFLRTLILFVFIFSLSSCSLKEAVDNNFKTKTEVKPFASSESTADIYGDGKTSKVSIKIPLTEDSVGYYDVDDVLGNGTISVKEKNFIERFKDTIKLNLYKLGVGLGLSNKVKFTSSFNFDYINPKFIKSAKVIKVFFTTDDCRPEDKTCDSNGRHTNNFSIVDKFFVNIKPSRTSETVEMEAFQNLDNKTFKVAEESSFSENNLPDNMAKVSRLTEHEDSDIQDDFEINLVKFNNNVPYLNLNTSNISDDEDYLLLNIKKNKTEIYRYLRGHKFRKYIKKISNANEGIEIELKRRAKPSDLFNAVDADQNPTLKRMFIYRLNTGMIEAKSLFESEKFNGIVKETNLIGRSLFVEVKDDESLDEFVLKTSGDKSLIKDFDLFRVERCVYNNCIDIKARDLNLVPIIEKSPMVDIDTYLSIDALQSRDFKYNGYIEVELEISLPL